MRLYRIRNWDEIYENNRSRTVKELSWVALPNRHDGFNYAQIITHERGAEIYSAWVLVIQVASRCQPRGSLVRDDGKPHNSATLSLKTRAPKEWFDFALEWIAKNTDWLDVQEVTEGRQETDTPPSPPCQSGDEGGRERKEGGSAPEIPSVDEVVSYGNGSPAIPETYCRHYHSKKTETNGWVKNGQLVLWKMEIVRWWNGDRHKWKGPKSEVKRHPITGRPIQ